METHCRDGMAADLGCVTEALHAYAEATRREPLMLGGWEVEDTEIVPPAGLLEQVLAIQPRPGRYAYGKDFCRAKARAAEVFADGVRFEGAPLRPEQVTVLQNSSQALLLALTGLREQGARRVVVAAPVYFSAVQVCRHLGLAVEIVPAADFFTGELDVDRLVGALGREPAVLIVTNPAYSLGVEYSASQLQRLFAALPERAWVLLDETRLGAPWGHDLPWYRGDFPARTLVLRSPSKIFLLNGLKTSFLFGPARLLREIERLSEALVGSGAGNAEALALVYLNAWHAWMRECETGQVGPMRAWKRALVARLHAHYLSVKPLLAEYDFTLSPVDSGPYALAGTDRERLPDLDSVAIARRQGVLLMTSEYFYHQSEDWQGFRLHLCGNAGRAREAISRVLSSQRSASVSDYAALLYG